MRILSLQGREVYDILCRDGVYHADITKCREDALYDAEQETLGVVPVWGINFAEYEMHQKKMRTNWLFKWFCGEMTLSSLDGFVLFDLEIEHAREGITGNDNPYVKVFAEIRKENVLAVYELKEYFSSALYVSVLERNSEKSMYEADVCIQYNSDGTRVLVFREWDDIMRLYQTGMLQSVKGYIAQPSWDYSTRKVLDTYDIRDGSVCFDIVTSDIIPDSGVVMIPEVKLENIRAMYRVNQNNLEVLATFGNSLFSESFDFMEDTVAKRALTIQPVAVYDRLNAGEEVSIAEFVYYKSNLKTLLRSCDNYTGKVILDLDALVSESTKVLKVDIDRVLGVYTAESVREGVVRVKPLVFYSARKLVDKETELVIKCVADGE